MSEALQSSLQQLRLNLASECSAYKQQVSHSRQQNSISTNQHLRIPSGGSYLESMGKVPIQKDTFMPTEIDLDERPMPVEFKLEAEQEATLLIDLFQAGRYKEGQEQVHALIAKLYAKIALATQLRQDLEAV
jgi:hypothetical protein